MDDFIVSAAARQQRDHARETASLTEILNLRRKRERLISAVQHIDRRVLVLDRSLNAERATA